MNKNAPIQAEHVRLALDHLEMFGLRKKGYGALGEPCCAVGHLRALLGRDSWVDGKVHVAFKRWPMRPASIETPTIWNDWETTTEADVALAGAPPAPRRRRHGGYPAPPGADRRLPRGGSRPARGRGER